MLFIPTSSNSSTPFTSIMLDKGQIYNMDLNESIGFQFNPTELEWSRGFNWVVHKWQGDFSGGDAQFLSTEPRKIELTLQFVADPSAPDLWYETPEDLLDTDNLVDFNAIRGVIERWEGPVAGKGRPSRIGIIMGENIFEGRIMTSTFRISAFFPDLTPRRAMFTLEFEEWIL